MYCNSNVWCLMLMLVLWATKNESDSLLLGKMSGHQYCGYFFIALGIYGWIDGCTTKI